jgi:hypothetical protein
MLSDGVTVSGDNLTVKIDDPDLGNQTLEVVLASTITEN